MTRTLLLIAAGVLPLALTAGAADAAKPRAASQAPAVQAVLDCRKIDDPTQRLACYDAAAAKMDAAGQSGDLVSLDKEQRRQVRKQSFGFTLPALSMFDTGEKGENDKIEETLARAEQDLQGKWIFVMQDGAIWRQIDDDFLSRRPHAGSAIVIRRAAIGSYMLSVDGQPGLRVHRDN